MPNVTKTLMRMYDRAIDKSEEQALISDALSISVQHRCEHPVSKLEIEPFFGTDIEEVTEYCATCDRVLDAYSI